MKLQERRTFCGVQDDDGHQELEEGGERGELRWGLEGVNRENANGKVNLKLFAYFLSLPFLASLSQEVLGTCPTSKSNF